MKKEKKRLTILKRQFLHRPKVLNFYLLPKLAKIEIDARNP